MTNGKTGLLLFLLADGLVWVRSSFGKLTGGKFVDDLGSILSKNSEHNPYPIYQHFLQQVAINNSIVFGQLTMWGEFLVAVSITSACLMLLIHPHYRYKHLIYRSLMLGLIGGIFLNMNFWLAFGWMDASADNLNLLMILIQLIGIWELKDV